MRTATKIWWLASVVFLFSVSAWASDQNRPVYGPVVPALYEDDEEEPEVKARVARISFLAGEAKVRRAGMDEWEKATLNLPLVEGDEIATDAGTRLEIQFDKYQHLRLAENSFLKIVSLKDNAIAVSLSLGTLNVRATSFDRDRSSFEIDAPRTTVAILRSGAYRVDAGRQGDQEVRVAAREGGEARVYSDTAGFTLKNGRSARVFIEGSRAGEWDTSDVASLTDEFDEWALDRDSAIARRLGSSYYDKYYDNDIYGADDLTDHGEWLYIAGYGNVWRPYSGATNHWADWSPYRYGHWRWMSPFGWVWVNDEPWGWATYHHGRWIYHHGRWYWSPYGYYRPKRSWWFPALVAITIFNNNTCWYPLGWRHRWRNYNWRYHHRDRRNPRINSPQIDPTGRKDIPIAGVVSVPTSQFGTGAKPTRPPATVATAVLTLKEPVEPSLPLYTDVKGRKDPAVIVRPPAVASDQNIAKTGAAVRADKPMDDALRSRNVFGNRPVRTDPPPNSNSDRKDTPQGVFVRPPVEPTSPPRNDRPPEPVVKDTPRNDRPRDTEPKYSPPVRPVERPRSDPPPTSRPQRSEPQPTRSEPPSSRPPQRSEPPPQKSEPKPSRSDPPASKPPASKDTSKDTGTSKKDKP